MRHFSSMMVRTVIALVCLVLLSLTLVAGLMTRTMINDQYQTNILREEEKVNSLTSLLDDSFYDYLSLAAQVTVLPELRPINLSRESAVSQINARDSLQALKAVNRNVTDLCLYLCNEDFIITSAATYLPESFVSSYYSFTGISKTKLLELFRQPGAFQRNASPLFVPVGVMDKGAPQADTLLIAMPLPQWSTNPYGTLGVFVQTDSILEQLSLVAGDGAARIVDSDGRTVIAAGESNLKNGFEPDDAVHVFGRMSSHFGLQYEAHIPDDVLRRTSMDLTSLLIPAAVLGLLACMGSLFFAKWVNQPIRQLITHIGGGDQKFLPDESGYIRQYIYQLGKSVEENEKYVDELLVRRLLAGEQLSDSEMRRCERFLQKDYAHCAVMLVRLNRRAEKMLPLAKISHEHALVHMLQEAQPDTLACVVASDESDEALLRQLGTLCAAPPFSDASIMAVGPVGDDLLQLHDSVLEAANLMKEMLYQGRTGMERVEQRNERRSVYPADTMHHLKAAVQAQDADKLLANCESICEELLDEGMDPNIGAIVVCDLAILFPRLSDLVSASAQAFCAALRSRVEELAAEYRDAQDAPMAPGVAGAARQEVAAVIDQLLEEPGFGISMISERYGLSDSAFSHMFKRTFGVNFITYVNQQKIQRAKTILAESSVSLDVVASRLGYSSASNFTRMFKNHEGITPGAYRQLLRSGSGEV